MAQSASATVDIETVADNAQFLCRGHRNHGKGLVDLEQIDLRHRPSNLVQQLADRRDRCGGVPGRFLAVGGVSTYFRQDRQAAAFGERLAHQHECGGAVRVGRRAGGRDRSVGTKRRFEQRNLLGGYLERDLVLLHQHFSPLRGYADGDDFFDKRSVSDGLARAAQGLGGIGILLGAVERESLGRVLAKVAHGSASLVGILQPVEHHVVVDRVMADPIAAACAPEQVGRIGHRLHAAGHGDVCRTGEDQVMGDHRRLHARAAYLVDRGGTRGIGEPGGASRLAGGGLALPRRQDATHEDFVHLLRFQRDAVERAPNGVRAKSNGAEGREFTEKATQRSTNCGDDDNRIGGVHDNARLWRRSPQYRRPRPRLECH